MSRSIHRSRLALPALLVALGTGTAIALPAQAASTWSPAAQLPAGCGGSVAVNASGAEVAAGYQQNADNTISVSVCTSADGQTWSGPVSLGLGVSPSVAIAPNGRAVAVWEGGPGTAATVAASVRPPGGQWSTPVTLTTDFGHPVVGMDSSGNAIAAWAAAKGAAETASLPAGGTWTAVKTLAAPGRAVDLAVNSTGAAIVTWATAHATLADSGTVLGGFAAPVTVGPPPPYPVGHTRVVLNDAGQAALVWATGSANMAATRSAGGTWSTVTQLSAPPDGAVDAAIDGAGDAIAVFGELHLSGTTTTVTLYTSKRPAGGVWGAPTVLSVPGDRALTPRAAADAAGTFVVGWADGTTGTLSVLTSPPGGGFGPATTFTASSLDDLKIAPGHAALTFATFSGAAEASSEPVS
jgi:hypothetical protein